MPDHLASDTERTSLPTHVDLCELRYRGLDARMKRVEYAIYALVALMIFGREHLLDVLKLVTPHVIVLALLAAPALAHELTEDPADGIWLRAQVSPADGTPCCDEHDCFLTEWRSRGGVLEARLQDGETWVALPPAAKLRESRYGRLLLCWNGRVLCWAEGGGV